MCKPPRCHRPGEGSGGQEGVKGYSHAAQQAPWGTGGCGSVDPSAVRSPWAHWVPGAALGLYRAGWSHLPPWLPRGPAALGPARRCPLVAHVGLHEVSTPEGCRYSWGAQGRQPWHGGGGTAVSQPHQGRVRASPLHLRVTGVHMCAHMSTGCVPTGGHSGVCSCGGWFCGITVRGSTSGPALGRGVMSTLTAPSCPRPSPWPPGTLWHAPNVPSLSPPNTMAGA